MTNATVELIFWMCVGVLVYVYAGYPLIVLLVGLLRPRPVERADIEPNVTVLITAFNEEAAIAEKLENTLRIDYPSDKLEILVASDGSTDATDSIVAGFASRGVKLVRQEGRLGKTMTQNTGVEHATGDILLFSDATTKYAEDVFRRILPNFADPTVGCVAGRLIYNDDDGTAVGHGARSYWSYETFLKLAEARACSLIGASGCLYAVRRSAYAPMYAEACSDFLICTSLYRIGLRSVYEPEAVCYERTNRRSDEEWRMRVRVISQTFTDLWRNRDMLNPFRSGLFAIELISHKLLRYAVPVVLAIAILTSAMLAHSFDLYSAVLIAQLGFYGLALLGWLLEMKGHRLRLLAMPLYFVLANLASVVAFYKFLRGESFARWEPIR
jgi:cellulose synthase/poly-beta-1,6-N-acetylglucosamine synthase-like glycosyltransferase